MTLEEINQQIKGINSQLSYIRRRDRVCLTFGADQEKLELIQKREELRKEKRKCLRKS